MQYQVMNRTDGIPAHEEPFNTPEEAQDFKKKFRQRFAEQGYYLTSDQERIHPDDIILTIQESE